MESPINLTLFFWWNSNRKIKCEFKEIKKKSSRDGVEMEFLFWSVFISLVEVSIWEQTFNKLQKKSKILTKSLKKM